MTQRDLLAELRRRPLLCDGAMGTQLMAAGLEPGQCGALWNVERPQVVQEVHRRYRQAGCDLITSNTFQGCREALAMHGLAERVAEINRAAAQNAREAAGADAWVLGDVGPFGGFLEPLGPTTPRQLGEIFAEQLGALREGGADAALIETMSDIGEVTVAVRAAKQAAHWPVIATYAFQATGKSCVRRCDQLPFRTMMGATVADAMRAALDAGADVVGANCGTDLDLEDYERLAGAILSVVADRAPVIVQPNAGCPKVIDGKNVHPAGPQEMAALAKRLLERGVRIIGGCCGTTPEHLGAMAAAMPQAATAR